MRFFLFLALLLGPAVATAQTTPADAWINELHYDNSGSDVGEFVEIALRTEYAAADYALYLYNGSNGEAYADLALDTCTAGATASGVTLYTCSPSSIQNGGPDGMVLVHGGSTVVQFLSYEGALTATDGPANGTMSLDIGVAEASSTPAGESLQLTGTGAAYGDFTWTGPLAETPGALNDGQTFSGGGGNTSVSDGDGKATLANADGALAGTFVFRRNTPDQQVELVLTGAAGGTLTQAAVTLPEGWAGLATENVALSGDAFANATAAVEGATVTVSGATLTDTQSGALTLTGLTPAAPQTLGPVAFGVQTAQDGGTLTALAAAPTALVTSAIADVRGIDANGALVNEDVIVAVEGTATVDFGTFDTDDLLVYLQDETAGLAVYGNDLTPTFEVGTAYMITGPMGQFNGLVQLEPTSEADIVSLGATTPVTAQTLTIADVLADAENFEGELLQIADASLAEGAIWPDAGRSGNVTIIDGTGELTLRVDSDTDLDEAGAPTGAFSVTGVFSQYDSNSSDGLFDGYQLLPRAAADLDAPTSATTYVQFSLASASVGEADGAVAISVAIGNPSTTAATTVDVALTGGTATAGEDFAAFTTQTLTFPAGSTDAQTVTLTLADDAAEEDAETVVFELQNVTGGDAAALGTPATFTLTVTDDDAVAEGEIFPGQSGDQLAGNLRAAYTPDQTLGYGDARDVLYSEIYAKDGVLSTIYTGFTIQLDPSADPSTDADNKGVNAEHLWPQSKGAGDEPQKSNMHILAPAKENVNSARGNAPFDEIPDAQTDRWYRDADVLMTIPTSDVDAYSEEDTSNPNSSFSSRFEPRESVKGDVARAVFYFYTIYRSAADRAFFDVQKDVLYTWHIQDPPSADEQARNEAIAGYQGKINPFVTDTSLVRRTYFVSGSGVINTAPTAPSITAPATDASFDLAADEALTVTWGAATDAEGDYLTYSVQLSVSDDFTTLLVNKDVDDATTYTLPFATFDALLAQAGVAPEATATVYARVFASDPKTSTASDVRVFSAVRRSAEAANTIAAARARGVGAEVTVEGVVTRAMGDFVRLQDETAGLTLRQTSGALFDAVASGEVRMGTQLRVSGTLSEYRGLLQLNEFDIDDSSLTVVEQDVTLPEPQTVTLRDLSTDGEAYESELVRIENLTISTNEATFSAAKTYEISDGSGAGGTVTLRTPNADDTAIDGVDVPEGTVTFTGVLGQFTFETGGYQLLPVNAEDVGVSGTAADTDGVPSTFGLHGGYPNPFAGQVTLTFDLPTTAVVTVQVFDVMGRLRMEMPAQARGAGAGQMLRIEGGDLTPGVYLYRLTAQAAGQTYVASGRLVRMK